MIPKCKMLKRRTRFNKFRKAEAQARAEYANIWGNWQLLRRQTQKKSRDLYGKMPCKASVGKIISKISYASSAFLSWTHTHTGVCSKTNALEVFVCTPRGTCLMEYQLTLWSNKEIAVKQLHNLPLFLWKGWGKSLQILKERPFSSARVTGKL